MAFFKNDKYKRRKNEIYQISASFKETIFQQMSGLLYCTFILLSPDMQRQTLTIGRYEHFSLQYLLRVWRNPHLLRSFQWPNVPVEFLAFLSTEFATSSKPPSRDKNRKVFIQGRNNVTRVRIETRSSYLGRRKNDAFPFHATLPISRPQRFLLKIGTLHAHTEIAT